MTKKEFAAKILSPENLTKKLADCRARGQKVVLTQGTFDLMHIGHGRYLTEAKRHGDVLFVGVDSDAKVRQRKGPDRPVVPEEERLEMLSYMEPVDFVILKPVEFKKWQLIKTIRPDVLIATQKTYSEAEKKALQEYCGEVVVLEEQATTSTSAKIRLMQIGTAVKITQTLSKKLIRAIEEVLEELK